VITRPSPDGRLVQIFRPFISYRKALKEIEVERQRLLDFKTETLKKLEQFEKIDQTIEQLRSDQNAIVAKLRRVNEEHNLQLDLEGLGDEEAK
jgi:hypothetical protein